MRQASTREEAARWVEVLKVLQTMDDEEAKVCLSVSVCLPGIAREIMGMDRSFVRMWEKMRLRDQINAQRCGTTQERPAVSITYTCRHPA